MSSPVARDYVDTRGPRVPVPSVVVVRATRLLSAHGGAEQLVHRTRYFADHPPTQIQPRSWADIRDDLNALVDDREIRDYLASCRGLGNDGYVVPSVRDSGRRENRVVPTLLEAVEACIVWADERAGPYRV